MKNIKNTFCSIQNFIFLMVMLLSIQSFSQLRFDYEYSDIEPTVYQVTYSLKYLGDTTDADHIRNVDMLLFLGEKTSLFTSKEYFSSDTMMRKITNSAQLQEHLLDTQRPFPKFLYKVYKNVPEGKLTFIEHIIDGTFKFEEDLDLFIWKLENETDSIDGYKVQMATCEFGGRSWTAWFSPEIPFSDGPYKFNGLPGLILKVGDTKSHYVFEFISIYKPDKELMIDMMEKDYVESTKMEFFKAKDNFREDIISRAKDAGLSSKDQQKAARNIAKKNNPIELIRK